MILQALCGYYDRIRDSADVDVPLLGYSRANVASVIVLDDDGNVKAIHSLMTPSGKQLRPIKLVVPEQPKRTVNIMASFLCENTEYLFGIYKNPNGALNRFDASRELHERILGAVDDVGAHALLRFFEKRQMGRYDVYGADSKPLEEKIGSVVFRLEGDQEAFYLHERKAIRAAWEAYRAQLSGDATMGQCLITGTTGPIARLHRNMIGFGQDKPTLVSFNKQAFESYGKTQGANAPVSESAAFRYATALNLLLGDRRHRVSQHKIKTVFWAERDAVEEENVFSMFMDMSGTPESSGLDEEECQKVRAIAIALLNGYRPADLHLDPDVRFFFLGMSANRTRLVIRYFHMSTFGEFTERVCQHFEDIAIVARETNYPSPWRLMRETAVGRKSENVPDNAEDTLLRCILEGTPYPYGIYQQMMLRIRAEAGQDGNLAFTRERVGYIKGYLNRAMRRDGKREEEMMTVALNEQETNPGYVIGRLMAALEYGQKAALGDVNASIVDKYLNASLASPQMVFGTTLLPLFKKHMNKLAKDGKEGSSVYIERIVSSIIDLLPSSGFPATLGAEDQGKYMIGYYHQNQALYTKKADRQENKEEKENV